jgi:hypothetical protein
VRKIALVTFFVFMVEAMVHYNQGLRKSNPELKDTFIVPEGRDLMTMIFTVAIFSVISSLLIAGKFPPN